jgi:beta-phosphoglucomutase-like phosphatase (HAD superfamily)
MAVHVHGRNNRHTLEYLLGEDVMGRRLEELSEEKETVYRDLCLDQGASFKLSPGAIELLDFLVQQQIPRTIATASAKPNVDFFIQHLELVRWFDLKKIVYDDGQKAGKPAPDFFLQAASVLVKNPEQCIVVEDSRSGIAAARAAHVGAIIALGPKKDHRELAQLEGVDLVVESLRDFPSSLFKGIQIPVS